MPSWTKLIHVKNSPVASTRRYHHIGIPTTESRKGERLIEHYATFVSGYETSAYGIEWMRFEPEAPVPELVRTVPHVAFEVDDLSAEIAGKEILIAPNSPSPGVTVAFTVNTKRRVGVMARGVCGTRKAIWTTCLKIWPLRCSGG